MSDMSTEEWGLVCGESADLSEAGGVGGAEAKLEGVLFGLLFGATIGSGAALIIGIPALAISAGGLALALANR